MRTLGDRHCEGCSKDYWRAQAWQHEKCVVVHKVDLVVHGKPNVVVHKRTGDRHKSTDARKAYKREWMRKSRANHV